MDWTQVSSPNHFIEKHLQKLWNFVRTNKKNIRPNLLIATPLNNLTTDSNLNTEDSFENGEAFEYGKEMIDLDDPNIHQTVI